MNILIIGSGGREHAIALKLYEEDNNYKLFISHGNGGTSQLGSNVNLALNNISEITDFCSSENIDLVVIGPEQPLVDGLADELRLNNILVFGPSKNAARIEGDKKFSKELMNEYNVPTAKFKSFSKTEYQLALEYLNDGEFPIVLKASGLAAGKGVIIANDLSEAKIALDDMLNNSVFGSAGDIVVIEEFLEGEELSLFVITDGNDYVILPASQDHKRIGEGDIGKNTGGMGAYSPLKFVDDNLIQEIERNVIIPTLKGLAENDSIFNGCLYCGLINTKDGIKVIEFNCRFGDPEIQAVLQLLDGNFLELLKSTAKGKVNQNAVKYNGGSSICIVAASGGYPDKYEKGFEIEGLPENTLEVKIIHAGTNEKADKIYTTGGRVLNIVGISKTNNLDKCKTTAYDTLSRIKFKDIYYRKDIGYKALSKSDT
jgi:phosphoribosylamine---glycine ligase